MSDHAGELLRRLASLGLRSVTRLRVTDNRTILVSLSRNGTLSVHRVYTGAPDSVLRAIVRFVAPGSVRAVRKAAERDIVAYHGSTAPMFESGTACVRRPDRPQPGDAEAVERLGLLFDDYNHRHFKAALPTVPIRLSGRMRTRLGHLTLDAKGRPAEITISRRHLSAHGWNEVAHTLLHEMVHLWQCANGLAVDHGPGFRAKARATGVTASARRWVTDEDVRKVASSRYRDSAI